MRHASTRSCAIIAPSSTVSARAHCTLSGAAQCALASAQFNLKLSAPTTTSGVDGNKTRSARARPRIKCNCGRSHASAHLRAAQYARTGVCSPQQATTQAQLPRCVHASRQTWRHSFIYRVRPQAACANRSIKFNERARARATVCVLLLLQRHRRRRLAKFVVGAGRTRRRSCVERCDKHRHLVLALCRVRPTSATTNNTRVFQQRASCRARALPQLASSDMCAPTQSLRSN